MNAQGESGTRRSAVGGLFGLHLPLPRVHSRRAAYIALALLTLVWGFNWIAMKAALFRAHPLEFNVQRIWLAVAVLFAALLARRGRFWPHSWRAVLVTAVFQTVINMGATIMGIAGGGAGRTSVLVFTMPFWTLLMAGPLLGEWMPRSQWPAVALAVAGLVGILSPWTGSLVGAASLFSLGAAWAWAISNIVAKRMRLHGSELLNVTAWQTLYGGVCLGALAFFVDSEPVVWTARFSVALAFNVLFATALAWLLWLYALNKMSAAASGLLRMRNAFSSTPIRGMASACLRRRLHAAARISGLRTKDPQRALTS